MNFKLLRKYLAVRNIVGNCCHEGYIDRERDNIELFFGFRICYEVIGKMRRYGGAAAVATYEYSATATVNIFYNAGNLVKFFMIQRIQCLYIFLFHFLKY